MPEETVKKSEYLLTAAEDRRRRLLKTKDPKISMVPMIDIVFQLIIFFMVVTEMAKLEIVELVLPQAWEAKDDKNPPPNRAVINITKDHEFYIKRKELTIQQVRRVLHRLAAESPKEAEFGLPTAAVKIRADAQVEYKWVQQVMVQCMREFIWQLSFGAMPKEP